MTASGTILSYAATVWTVSDSLYGAVDLKDCEDRLIADLVIDPIARLGDLLEMTRHLPDARLEVLFFELIELAVVEALVLNVKGISHREGDPATTVGSVQARV